MSAVALPCLTTTLPRQLERQRKREREVKRSELPKQLYVDATALTLYEAGRDPCRRLYRRTSHPGTAHTSHQSQPSLRTNPNMLPFTLTGYINISLSDFLFQFIFTYVTCLMSLTDTGDTFMMGVMQLV